MTIESRPLGHGLDVDCGGCDDCMLLERLQPLSLLIFDWQVIGEGVVRGQMFQAGLWRYVLLRDLRYIDVTAEALADNEQGFHAAALQALATGRAEVVRWLS
jgi:hypothetical protein